LIFSAHNPFGYGNAMPMACYQFVGLSRMEAWRQEEDSEAAVVFVNTPQFRDIRRLENDQRSNHRVCKSKSLDSVSAFP
jgi:hypothetical protein